jgi:hypothetical protein
MPLLLYYTLLDSNACATMLLLLTLLILLSLLLISYHINDMLPSHFTLFSTDFRFLREWLIVDCEIAHLYLRVGVGFFALGQFQHRPVGRPACVADSNVWDTRHYMHAMEWELDG